MESFNKVVGVDYSGENERRYYESAKASGYVHPILELIGNSMDEASVIQTLALFIEPEYLFHDGEFAIYGDCDQMVVFPQVQQLFAHCCGHGRTSVVEYLCKMYAPLQVSMNFNFAYYEAKKFKHTDIMKCIFFHDSFEPDIDLIKSFVQSKDTYAMSDLKRCLSSPNCPEPLRYFADAFEIPMQKDRRDVVGYMISLLSAYVDNDDYDVEKIGKMIDEYVHYAEMDIPFEHPDVAPSQEEEHVQIEIPAEVINETVSGTFIAYNVGVENPTISNTEAEKMLFKEEEHVQIEIPECYKQEIPKKMTVDDLVVPVQELKVDSVKEEVVLEGGLPLASIPIDESDYDHIQAPVQTDSIWTSVANGVSFGFKSIFG